MGQFAIWPYTLTPKIFPAPAVIAIAAAHPKIAKRASTDAVTTRKIRPWGASIAASNGKAVNLNGTAMKQNGSSMRETLTFRRLQSEFRRLHIGNIPLVAPGSPFEGARPVRSRHVE